MRTDKNPKAKQKDEPFMDSNASIESTTDTDLQPNPKGNVSLLTDTVAGYEHFASYFINSDATGLYDSERQEADRFLQRLRKEYGDDAYIVDAGSDTRFSFPEYGGLYGAIVTYTGAFSHPRSFR